MLHKFSTLNKIKHALIQLPGFKTARKIVVFESDDWGSIRMPNKDVFDNLKKILPNIDNLPYQKYDTLASSEDLEKLFEVLTKHYDAKGNHPVITANTIVANPDFKKIKESNFTAYFYESFTETLDRYYGNKVFKLWQEGITKGIFYPQFHGREHINIKRWMHALRQNIGQSRVAFDNQMFDLSDSLVIGENSFMDALDIETVNDINDLKILLNDGLNLFEKILGYRSKTFIAPCYIWPKEIESTLLSAGVIAMQGSWFQKQPVIGAPGKYNNIYHYTGEKNRQGMFFTIRNAAFEPADNINYNWIGDLLKRAEIAFAMGKPLIISTHRINFIGSIVNLNRDRNLKLFNILLEQLLQKYPDLEFMHSAQLANMIKNKD